MWQFEYSIKLFVSKIVKKKRTNKEDDMNEEKYVEAPCIKLF